MNISVQRLRICATAPPRRLPSIKTDEYLPLDVQWAPGDRVIPVYWEVSEGYSHVEIGADPDTGEILSLTVISAGATPVLRLDVPEPESPVIERNRHPVCDLSLWEGSDGFVDAVATFELTLYADALRISLGREEYARSIESGPVRFDVSATGELMGISLSHLSEDQRRQVVETADRQRAFAGLPMPGTG